MAVADVRNKPDNLAEVQGSVVVVSMKEAFREWLTTAKVRRFLPSVCVSCIDKASEYALQKSISTVSFWDITEHSVYKKIYIKVLGAKLLRKTDSSTYVVFIVAGKLYYEFLKEQTWLRKEDLFNEEVEEIGARALTEASNLTPKAVDPEDVIEWLLTQPNKQGTLYLENVVRQYMSSLRSTPEKFAPLIVASRDVFACQTVAELTTLWSAFKAAPSYTQLNTNTSNSFSAGLACLQRYLECRSTTCDKVELVQKLASRTPIVMLEPVVCDSSTTPSRVDFSRPELCADTRPLTCSIRGKSVALPSRSWAQLLVAITEVFIAEQNPKLPILDHQPLYGSRTLFMPSKADLGASYVLSDGKWMYANYNPKTMVRIIGNLCLHCGVSLDDVVITYVTKELAPERSDQLMIHDDACPSAVTAATMRGASVMNRAVFGKSSSSATIKDLVIRLLEAAHRGMTTDEIYKLIVDNRLYIFGAQDPKHVLRNVIERACENSNYANRDQVLSFRSEEDCQGKRIYFLLEQAASKTANQTVATAHAPVCLLSSTGEATDIWKEVREENLQECLVDEGHSLVTSQSDCKAMPQVARNCQHARHREFSDSDSQLDSDRKFVTSLNIDKTVELENATGQAQCAAELSSFADYCTFASPLNVECSLLKNNADSAEMKNGVRGHPFDDIIDFDEGKAGIREILATHFLVLLGYSNINLLWSATQSSMSMFLNDNAINTQDALWQLLCRVFEGELVLSSPHIWQKKPDYPLSTLGLVLGLAEHHGGLVTREQIDDYFSRIRFSAPHNGMLLNHGMLLFYEDRKFILKEAVCLTRDRCFSLSRAMGKLFADENLPYIVLRDISEEWFLRLPELRAGIPWTALLLQEVLRICRTLRYRVVLPGLNGQALNTLGAAIVPSKSEIVNFADVVHRYCYEKYTLPIKMQAEELRLLLRGAGMLAGNELIYNMHKVLRDHRFGFTEKNQWVKILER